MKIKRLQSAQPLLLISVLLLIFVFFTSSALAVNKPDTVGRPSNVGGEKKQQVQVRLAEAKLKACQAKEGALKKRTEQLAKLTTVMQEKFDAIAGRVEEYYVSKAVPNEKTVTNYDSLAADIQTKKEAVQSALTAAQGNVGSFACDGNNPKGQLVQFREDMLEVKSALKDYRTSIKNLIVAVRSIKGTVERANPSVSPKITE